VIGRFTRREKPAQRMARIAQKKVDPAMAKAIRRALGSEGTTEGGAGSGPGQGMSKMPGTNTHQKPWDTMGSDYTKKAG